MIDINLLAPLIHQIQEFNQNQLLTHQFLAIQNQLLTDILQEIKKK